ncbi:GntR family transcriptional regulator [Alkalibaculum sp. M08DMB]|uniref:GntR family transcriptional regulator n=1 Tax=Alkalibaculum sporogenes TaxID=2655001 RepID=A0A6A7K6M7_9FIRM|nr:GntR family transcriptional regulator [Alkalibaculum sporogenes]MPW24867.1 GntR family transcriptional regulator [Alkalibaculum sporogenes]
MSWILDDNRPIYIQLVEQIQMMIITGFYPLESKLPSVRDMASEASVNPNTMQRAFAQLEAEGLLYSDRTKGRFVTKDKEKIMKIKNELAISDTKNYIKKMKELGCDKNQIENLIDAAMKEEQ